MNLKELRKQIKIALSESFTSKEPESFYRDAQDREDDYTNAQAELQMIKRAGLDKEYEALMKGIFALPLSEFDKRAAAIDQLKHKAERIVSQLKTETTCSESWQIEPLSKGREAKALGFANDAYKAADSVYGGVYKVDFHSISRDGAEFWKVSLHSPTGPVKWIYRDKSGKWFYSSGDGVNSSFKEVPQVQETISRSELKEVIKHTLRTILNEMNRHRRTPFSMLDEAISPEDLESAWREDQSGEYVQINPDDSVWYVAHGRAKEQIAPKGSGPKKFGIIKNWMEKNQVFFNIWGVNDHGNVELYNRVGKSLGGLVEQLYEMTTTGAVAPINLPGNVKGGWVSAKGGSARGVAGSKSLGYELTPIGKEDMARKQDPVYE